MTEKTNTGDLVLDRNGYFHVVYLISDEEKLYSMSNYYIGHIDNCTLVLTDEKLQELRKPKDRQPTLAVGEYYFYKSMENVPHILKITAVMGNIVEAGFLDTETGKLINTRIELDKKYVQPATAEQIATFQRAEHFASKGRKLDEFRVGDRIVIDGIDEIVKIESLRGSAISGTSDLGNSYSISLLGAPVITFIQTAEELQEVRDND